MLAYFEFYQYNNSLSNTIDLCASLLLNKILGVYTTTTRYLPLD